MLVTDKLKTVNHVFYVVSTIITCLFEYQSMIARGRRALPAHITRATGNKYTGNRVTMRYRKKHGIVPTRRRRSEWILHGITWFVRVVFTDRLDESGRPDDFNVPRARRRLERPVQREPRELPDVVFAHKGRGRNRPGLLYVPSEHDRDAKTNRLSGRAG